MHRPIIGITVNIIEVKERWTLMCRSNNVGDSTELSGTPSLIEWNLECGPSLATVIRNTLSNALKMSAVILSDWCDKSLTKAKGPD